MRFTISREALSSVIGAVLPAVDQRSTLPVITHFLVETINNGVRFTGTDLDHRIAVDAPADVHEPGAITLPAKKLAEIAAKLPLSPVEFGEKRGGVAIKCGSARFTLAGLPSSEFPTWTVIGPEGGHQVRMDVLGALIKQVTFAASREESRPILNGVHWELRPDSMRLVATDGKRLAKADHRIAGAKTPATFDVPVWALEQAARLFDVAEELVTVTGDKNHHLCFQSPHRTLVTRLVEGPYPQYDLVIPADNDRFAVLDKAAFMSAVERVKVTATDAYETLRLAFDATGVDLSSETKDTGSATDRCAAQFTGEPMQVKLDATYLLETLRHLPGDEVKVSMKSSRTSVVFSPANENSQSAYLCLLMVLR